MSAAQVLTAEKMREAETGLFDTGTSVSDLMEVAAAARRKMDPAYSGGAAVSRCCGGPGPITAGMAM